jgi:hypothetical protein
VQKAGTAYQTFKGKNLQSIVRNEANAVVQDVIRGQLPGAVRQTANAADGFFFPKVPVQQNSTTTDPASPSSAEPTLSGPASQAVPTEFTRSGRTIQPVNQQVNNNIR